MTLEEEVREAMVPILFLRVLLEQEIVLLADFGFPDAIVSGKTRARLN
jgi:hypothetical protein